SEKSISKLLDYFVTAALGLERRDDALLDHQADLAVRGVAVDLADALVVGRGKRLSVRVRVGEQPPLAHGSGAELIQPAQRALVIDRRIAQRRREDKPFGRKFRRLQAVIFHLLKHA